MERKNKLMALFSESSKTIMSQMIDEIIFLEDHLKKLKNMPFISVNPNNPIKQRNTPAGKMYKEFLQQYINCIKMVEYAIYKEQKMEDKEATESPLRKWFKENVDI